MVSIDMQHNALKAYGIWFCGALFFLYEYFVRVIPSVLTKIPDSPLNGMPMSQIASAVSLYFLIYSPMQLFVGPLFDTFGSRKLFIFNCGLLACACLLPMIPIHTLQFLGIGRFAMGFASAFGFVGVLYLCATWCPRKHLALLSGLTTMLGLIGTVSSQALFSAIDVRYNTLWKSACLFGCCVTIFLFFVLPKDRPAGRQPVLKNICGRLKHVAKNPAAWACGFLSGTMYLPFGVFADLWAIPYFTKIGHLTPWEAAQLTSILNISWSIACPIMGWISDAVHSRKKPLIIGGITSTACFAALILNPHASFTTFAWIMVLLGICCGTQVISFVACADSNPENMSASAMSFTNMLCMITCGLFQPLIGYIIERFNPNTSLALAYQVGLSTILAINVLATVCFEIFFKEKSGDIQANN